MRTRIFGGTIVMPTRTAQTDLWIEDERVAAIGERSWTPDATTDASGCYLFPGGIDPHVHMGFTVGEFTSTDSFATGSRAAAFGGVTTILDFAVPEDNESISAAVRRRIEQAEGEASVDYGIHAVISRIPEDLPEQIRQCIKIGTPDFKTFTTYVGLQLTSRDLLQAMRRVSEVGGLIMVHAEQDEGIRRRVAELVEQGLRSPQAHAMSRPSQVEADAVREVLQAQAESGCSVHFVHISSDASVTQIREAQAHGRDLSGETCPQYLFHTDEVYAGAQGALFMISPPIKTKADQAGLWDGVQDRTLGMIATDHCPFSLDQKAKYNDFREIPTGMPGVETTLPLMYTAWMDRAWPLERLVCALSTQTAKRFGLFPRKGTLEPGSDADLVIYEPGGERVLHAGSLHMNVDWSPFEDFRVRGSVRDVFLRGRRLIEAGEWVGKMGAGRFVPRSLDKESSTATWV